MSVSGLYEDVRLRSSDDNVTAVYVSPDTSAPDPDFRYSSGEKLRISVIKWVIIFIILIISISNTGCTTKLCLYSIKMSILINLCFSPEQQSRPVLSDKLTIEIHHETEHEHDAGADGVFDPDTLERHLDKKQHQRVNNNNNDDDTGVILTLTSLKDPELRLINLVDQL